jgi:hypothetical protein
MVVWKKGAVIGGIWGMITGFIWRKVLPSSQEQISLIENIIFSPPILSNYYILDPLYFFYTGPSLEAVLVFSILIGGFIGLIIGLSIEKYKQWRLSK